MRDKVTIADDTLRRNAAGRITTAAREQATRMGLPISPGQQYYIIKDRGQTVVQSVKCFRTYEGEHLRLAVHRARRYIRSGRPLDKAPRHIAHALAAFLAADRKGFKDAIGVGR